MLVVSFFTSLLGLTEPLFVPEYWSPPSLFDLASRTGFDLESPIFSFGIGGIVVALYSLIFKSGRISVSNHERHNIHHRFHALAILSAPILFIVLLFSTNFNPIYSAIISMIIGGFATWYCRPDLKAKMLVSAFLFLLLYAIYFYTLISIAPGYVEDVWNLNAITGILLLGIPVEELLFAFSFGFIWSSIYEHLAWRKIVGLNEKIVRT